VDLDSEVKTLKYLPDIGGKSIDVTVEVLSNVETPFKKAFIVVDYV
jgi:hypothetical protein